MENKYLALMNLIVFFIAGLYLGGMLGASRARAEEKEVMIKHLISPFHNAEHVWKDDNKTDYQVVPSEMNCNYIMDSTITPIDTTDG
jgi:hypothetical protein